MAASGLLPRLGGLGGFGLGGLGAGLLRTLGIPGLAGIGNGLAIGILIDLLAPRPLADGTRTGNPDAGGGAVPGDWGNVNQAPSQIKTLPMPSLAGDGVTFQTAASCTVVATCTGVDRTTAGVSTPYNMTLSWGDANVVGVSAMVTEFTSSRDNYAPFGPAGEATARVTFRRSNGTTSVREQVLGVQANSGNGLNLMTRSWAITSVTQGGVPLTGGQEVNAPIAASDVRSLDPFIQGRPGTTAPSQLQIIGLVMDQSSVQVAGGPSPQLPSAAPVPFIGGGGEGGSGGGTGAAPLPQAPPSVAPRPLPAPTRPQAPPAVAPQQPPAVPGPAPSPPLPQEAPVLPMPAPVVPTPGPLAPTPPGVEQAPLGPIGGPAQQPPATLEGIAAEVGRIEQKLLQLQRPLGQLGGDTTDLLQLLGQLLELLMSLDGSGGYQLSSPCERDASGAPLPPVEVSWGQSVGLQGAVVKRIDALAELLQVHKDLKQPICRPGRAQGQPVTVTFEEVPEV